MQMMYPLGKLGAISYFAIVTSGGVIFIHEEKRN